MDQQAKQTEFSTPSTFTYAKYLETCRNCRLGNNDFETLIKNRALIDDYCGIWYKRYKKCYQVIDDIGINGIVGSDTDFFARWLAFNGFDDFFCLPENETGGWPMKWMNHTKQLYKKFKEDMGNTEAMCYGQCELYETFLQYEMDETECDRLLGDDYDYGKIFDFYLKSNNT